MNVLPFAGYWFYGAANADARAGFFTTWGLLASPPDREVVKGGWIRAFLGLTLH
jgi:hypothetical protein